MKSRLHLVILFLAIILIILAQATSVAESRLLAESMRWSQASQTTLQVRYLMRLLATEKEADSTENTLTEQRFRDLQQKMLLELDGLANTDSLERTVVQTAISSLNRKSAEFHLKVELIEGQLLALATAYGQRESAAWGQSRRYSVLSRISWFSFAFIATLLIYWNASLRGRMAQELEQRDIQTGHQVAEATAELEQEVSRLNQLVDKLRED